MAPLTGDYIINNSVKISLLGKNYVLQNDHEHFGPLNSVSLVTMNYMQLDYPVQAQSGASRDFSCRST
jgi:hypothetical protein